MGLRANWWCHYRCSDATYSSRQSDSWSLWHLLRHSVPSYYSGMISDIVLSARLSQQARTAVGIEIQSRIPNLSIKKWHAKNWKGVFQVVLLEEPCTLYNIRGENIFINLLFIKDYIARARYMHSFVKKPFIYIIKNFTDTVEWEKKDFSKASCHSKHLFFFFFTNWLIHSFCQLISVVEKTELWEVKTENKLSGLCRLENMYTFVAPIHFILSLTV